MIANWLNKKIPNQLSINNKINNCVLSNQFTNNGQNVINLQQRIKTLFNIDNNKNVLMVCNGTMGLNALVAGLSIFYNKPLKFAVQAFTFPCSVQGLLMNSLIYDIDENGGIDLECLERDNEKFDGILITNCFGCSTNIRLYEEFCNKYDKILLFDNACTSHTEYDGNKTNNCDENNNNCDENKKNNNCDENKNNNYDETYKNGIINKNQLNYGNGCMVSLHHTKPIGFGEGGFIVFDEKYLESMQKAICFGYTNDNHYNYQPYASNFKMSEIASIYIDDYLNNFEQIKSHHLKIAKYFIKKLNESNLNNIVKLYGNFSDYSNTLLSTLPILFNHKVDIDFFVEHKIEVKKYYYPLDLNCSVSLAKFNNIICFPLNLDINESMIDFYIGLIIKFAVNKL